MNNIPKCNTCKWLDMPHPREPAWPCCTINYNKDGYWQEKKKPNEQYCSEHSEIKEKE